MSAVEASAPPLSRRGAAWLVGIGLVAFVLFLGATIAGTAPGAGQRTAAHAVSKSAVGYAGLVRLLRADGRAVEVRREARQGDDVGLLVLTPGPEADPQKLTALARGHRVLLVPAKWLVLPDPGGGALVRRIAAQAQGLVAAVKAAVPASARAGWFTSLRAKPRALRLSEPGGRDGLRMPRTATAVVKSPRTFSSKAWEPVLVDTNGDAILLISTTAPVYLLTEPDLLNNAGIRDLRTARVAAALLPALAEGGPIAFDVSLNGLGARPNPLREVLTGRFAGAVLGVVLAGALLAWLAFAPFGAPPPPERVYAFGKRALVDSAASLLAFERREPRLAGRYGALVRAQALRALGVRLGDPAAEEAALDRAAANAGAEPWSALAPDAPAANRSELMAKAARLHAWKTEVTGGRG